MRSSWLATGILLLLSVPLMRAQTNAPTQPEGRITGTVINADGEPISQADVCKIITRARSSSTNCSAARADEHGGFEITHVEMGKVGLYAEKNEAGYWDENGSTTQTVTLTPEKPAANVILNLGGRPGELSIVVRDKAAGKPVAPCTARSIQGDHTFINTCEASFALLLRPDTDAIIQVSAPGYKNWYYIDPNDPSQPVLRLKPGEQKSLEVELEPKP